MNFRKILEFLVDNFIEEEIIEFATMYTKMFLEIGNIDFAIMSSMIIEELSNH